MDLIERLTKEVKDECQGKTAHESKALSIVWNRFCDTPEFETVDTVILLSSIIRNIWTISEEEAIVSTKGILEESNV